MGLENKRYVTLSTFAKLSGVGISNMSQRLKKSFEGQIHETDKRYIELCEHPECEGYFIDTDRFKPVRFNQKRTL